MPFLVVAVISVLVGVAVYVGTVGGGQSTSSTLGFGDGPTIPPDTDLPPGTTYLRVSTQLPAVRERLQGVVGLVLLLGLGAAALAFALFQAGHLVNRTIEAFLEH